MERVWAHAIERAETGAVLLATLKAPRLLNDARMWQVRYVQLHGWFPPEFLGGPDSVAAVSDTDLAHLSELCRWLWDHFK